jgi:uncharacterized protein
MIKTLAELRSLYAAPKERTLLKQLTQLDVHCRRFIELSPLVVLASSGTNGWLDNSPRGGDPGFVQVQDAHTLLLPDAPGNNRLDSLENIVNTGELGMLFLIPGVDETLRINGSAQLSIDAEHLQVFAAQSRPPKLVIKVRVRDAYLHCAKAMMRSQLWSPDRQLKRDALPTMGTMIADQTGIKTPPETQAEMLARYQADL